MKTLYSGWIKKVFTLIELLVTIAIIAILASLLLPALRSAKEKGKSIMCSGNLRQIGVAVACYINDYDGWLPHQGSVYWQSPWQYLIAPNMGILPTSYNLNHGVFQCPCQTNPTCGYSGFGYKGFYGGYGWNYGYLGWRDTNNGTQAAWRKITEVKTPSEVICSGDTSDIFANNTSYDPAYVFYLMCWDLWGIGSLCESSRHNKGGNYLWCDGHVNWNSASEVFRNRGRWYVLH